LVVTFILAAMIGLVTLQLTRSDSDLLKDEADRLATVLLSAREEAILRGQLIAFEMENSGYRFLYVGDKRAFTPFEQGPLASRRFDNDITVRLELEGQAAATGKQRLMFDPSGAVPLFRIGFSRREADWWVQGNPDGKIRSLGKLDDKTS
jgi:general secretion pathway protein H